VVAGGKFEMPTKLYVWARPIAINDNLDHTWVTSYDTAGAPYSSLEEVAAAGEYCWMCWGDFHPQANPVAPIATGDGDVAMGSCLVEPNARSQTVRAARGTIFTYGLDGVCHQLTNQALVATGIDGCKPLTVKNANGYKLSSFLYGTYGRQHDEWREKTEHCAPDAILEAPAPLEAVMTDEKDEFEEHAESVLANDPEKLEQLKALRGTSQDALESVPVALDADSLNAQNQQIFDEAAKLLSPEEYEQMFGVKPGEKVDLVDPEMLEGKDR